MKIALIGATGYVGSKVLQEALDRGHQVTAVVRDTARLPAHPHLTTCHLDVLNTADLSAALAGHDVVVSAYNPRGPRGDEGALSIIRAVVKAGIPRLLVVGGAGSLEIAPGKRLLDSPDFPQVWKGGAEATARFLELLRKEPSLDWTFISPAALLQPGARTGQFRLGGDQLLTDSDGKSRISLEDYAKAMIDEVENSAHPRQRFSVAY